MRATSSPVLSIHMGRLLSGMQLRRQQWLPVRDADGNPTSFYVPVGVWAERRLPWFVHEDEWYQVQFPPTEEPQGEIITPTEWWPVFGGIPSWVVSCEDWWEYFSERYTTLQVEITEAEGVFLDPVYSGVYLATGVHTMEQTLGNQWEYRQEDSDGHGWFLLVRCSDGDTNMYASFKDPYGTQSFSGGAAHPQHPGLRDPKANYGLVTFSRQGDSFKARVF